MQSNQRLNKQFSWEMDARGSRNLCAVMYRLLTQKIMENILDVNFLPLCNYLNQRNLFEQIEEEEEEEG